MTEERSEKEQFWRWVMAEQADSGLSIRAFCKREDLSEPNFYAWRRTIGERDALETGTLQGGQESKIKQTDSALPSAEPTEREDRTTPQPQFLPVHLIEEPTAAPLSSPETSVSTSTIEIESPSGWFIRLRSHPNGDDLLRRVLFED